MLVIKQHGNGRGYTAKAKPSTPNGVTITTVPGTQWGEAPLHFFKKKTGSNEPVLVFENYSAIAIAVMWGFTPSYQYRKPSTSTTLPTSRVPTVV